ncbi:uncharacterized protein KY384_001132 [Bacidia gigantensis]|uniref:uncharacterized protein n=1 Tax=Bacidia gigantensis TaxID=2732470 RepID=UPI001D038BDC|nr:uncharacterized protein KY384_001132 [Bacidia gigantensis]KAG8534288.1 hypothetical protein KY384_001132 [Bacidia gigantensis]
MAPRELIIRELGPCSLSSTGKFNFLVDIEENGIVIYSHRTIEAPSSEEANELLRQRLGFRRGSCESPQGSVRLANEEIDNCRKSLHAQLPTDNILRPGRVNIRIHAFEAQPINIQRIPWEGLGETKDIAIIRIGGCSEEPPTPTIQRVDTKPIENKSRKRCINVLLVVNRKVPLNGEEMYKDSDSGTAYRALRQAQTLAKENRAKHQVNIDLICGKSIKGLQAHLHEKGTDYYHAVHFDCHGKVMDGTTYIQLTREDWNQEKLENVRADRIGKLLAEYGIKCAVLNACESGTAIQGRDANLCQIFNEFGISTVLGMSHSISVDAAKIFLGKFYYHLLVEGREFSHSVALARAALQENRERVGKSGQKFEIADWIVPVLWSDGKDFQITVEVNGDPSKSRPPLSPLRASNPLHNPLGCVLDILFLLICLRSIFRRHQRFPTFNEEVTAYQSLSQLEEGIIEETHLEPMVMDLGSDHLRAIRDLGVGRILYIHDGEADDRANFMEGLTEQLLATNSASKVEYKTAKDFVSTGSRATSTYETWLSLFRHWGSTLCSSDEYSDGGSDSGESDVIDESSPPQEYECILILDILDLYDENSENPVLMNPDVRAHAQKNFLSYLDKHIAHGRAGRGRFRVIFSGQDSHEELRRIIQKSIPSLRNFASHPFTLSARPEFFDPTNLSGLQIDSPETS